MPYQPIGKYEGSRGFARKTDFKRPVTFFDRVRFVGDDSTMEIFGGVLSGDISADLLTLGTLDAARIVAGSLDGDKITANTLDADRITAGTITTERLVIGSFDNLVPDPGFESDTLDNYGTGSVGGDWNVNGTIRSGAVGVQYVIAGDSGDANIWSGTDIADLLQHPSAAEGDEFHMEVWVRPGGTGSGVRTIELHLRSYAEDGTFLDFGSTIYSSVPGFTFTKLTSETICPAGTAYVVPYVRIKYDAGKTIAVYAIDDWMLRRKVGTLVIEGQAVDIERMLNPVDVTTEENRNSGGASLVNPSSDEVVVASITHTIPAWVGAYNIMSTGNIQIRSTLGLVGCGIKFAGEARNSYALNWPENSSEGRFSASVTDTKSISSPGSSFVVQFVAWAIPNYTLDAGDAYIDSLGIGVR